MSRRIITAIVAMIAMLIMVSTAVAEIPSPLQTPPINEVLEPPAANLYPLTITVQPTVKGSRTVDYVITVTLAPNAKFPFGPWVTIESYRTVVGINCPHQMVSSALPFPNEWPRQACFIGKLRPGQSRTMLVSYPQPSVYGYADNLCDVSFTLHDTYYNRETHVSPQPCWAGTNGQK